MTNISSYHAVIPAPDQVEGRLQRESRCVVVLLWVPASAGTTKNCQVFLQDSIA